MVAAFYTLSFKHLLWFTVLLLTPFWFLNEYYGLLYTKLHYIGPVESILEGLEILEVLSEELKLPGLKGLCLEPT